MKKILFLCNNHFDLYKIFQKGIEEYSGCEVITIPIVFKEFKYQNLKQRVQNFFSKIFLGKNLKQFWLSEANFTSISKNDKFDYVLVICPELLHPKHLMFLNEISTCFLRLIPFEPIKIKSIPK